MFLSPKLLNGPMDADSLVKDKLKGKNKGERPGKKAHTVGTRNGVPRLGRVWAHRHRFLTHSSRKEDMQQGLERPLKRI